MQDAQQIYNRLSENKTKLKDLKDSMKEIYMSDTNFVDFSEQKKTINSEMGFIKTKMNGQNQSLVTKIDDLKIDIDSDKELLTDILLTTMMKGQTIELEDKETKQLLLPIFTAKLIKKD